jgi:hypothetical protein
MASGQIVAKEPDPTGSDGLLRRTRSGWSQSLGFFKETVLWLFKVHDLVESSLAKLHNESRLRAAYRELGEFLFQRLGYPELDEGDLVELDLLIGKIAEIRAERERLVVDWGNSDRLNTKG